MQQRPHFTINLKKILTTRKNNRIKKNISYLLQIDLSKSALRSTSSWTDAVVRVSLLGVVEFLMEEEVRLTLAAIRVSTTLLLVVLELDAKTPAISNMRTMRIVLMLDIYFDDVLQNILNLDT